MARDDFDDFEWDDDKNQSVLARWGFDFDFAVRVFDEAYVEREDRRVDYGESRFIATGNVDGYMISVAWTPRDKTRRIITAWPSGSRDIRRYNGYRQANQGRDPQQ